MRSFTQIFFAILLVVTSCAKILAQSGNYQIKNYPPKAYDGHNQVWCTAQDSNGILYFGGTSYIFRYDGLKWKKIPARSGAAVRQLYFDKKTQAIYVGCVGSFGYLDFDSKHQPHYVSISDSFPANRRNFSDIWKIYKLNKRVYFQSSEAIYVVNDKKLEDVITADKDHLFALSFQVDDQLFIRQRGKGLLMLKGSQFVNIEGGEQFADVRLLEILPMKKPNTWFVLSGDKGAWEMTIDPQNGKPVVSKQAVYTDEYLVKSGVLGARWVNDSVFAVNGRNGLGLYSDKVVLKEIINEESGLSDMTISQAFVDRERNIWLVHNYGISMLSYNKGLQVYSTQNSGFRGAMESMVVLGPYLYIGTTEGVYYTDYPQSGTSLQFKPVPMEKAEVWDIKVINNELFAATSFGLVKIKGTKAEYINNYYCTQITASTDPSKLLVLEKSGLTIYDLQNGKVKELANMESGGLEMISASRLKKEGTTYTGWASTRFRELIHFSYDSLTKKWDTTVYDTINGLTAISSLIPIEINGKDFFCWSSDIFEYVPAKDTGRNSVCFVPRKDILNRILDKHIEGLNINNNYRVFFTDHHLSETLFFGIDKANNQICKKLVFTDFYGDEVQCIYADPYDKVWVLDAEHISRINLKARNNADVKYQAIITSMLINKDSVIFSTYHKANDILNNELPYKFNSIRFQFAAPFFDRSEILAYTYILEGFDERWSDTSTVNNKEYTNLPEGNYTFRVKAINAYNKFSNEASVSFEILSPWYRTKTAYVIYFLSFLSVIWLAVRISGRRLIRRQENLEQIIKERTEEVVQQKLLIEEKAEELSARHKEITDSINYAERIQRSFLATKTLLDKQLGDYFVFFQPKDIVSGDFYWAGTVKDGRFALMVADSTGHGVPGAIMSILNISSVEKAVEQGLCEPSEILNQTRKLIIERLSNDGTNEGGKEGMDGSLVCFDFKKRTLTYAAAYNPIIIIRNGLVIELKADKMPIGRHDKDTTPFMKEDFEWQPGDVLYAFTDGMPDQFGGPKGKKFMYKQLKQLLTEMATAPMNEQYHKLKQVLNDWKRDLEQIDDICIIGVRLK